MSISILTILLIAWVTAPVEEFPKGEPVESVVCRENPQQSYALYLPSSYTPEKRWPVLICFDPARRGMLPVTLFRQAAERHGILIVSSNNFRSDEDFSIAQDAMSAIWNDILERFPLDPQRLYATGFSGGARISWSLASGVKAQFAGIIGVGGGLPWPDLPSDWPAETAFYGLAGNIDFNYYEMRELQEQLDRRGTPNRFVSFEGGHRWPEAEDCNRALDWMEVRAMKRGLRAAEEDFLDEFYDRGLESAKAAASAGDLVLAHRELKDLAEALGPLRDVSEALSRLKALQSSTELKKQDKRVRREAANAVAYLERVEAGLNLLAPREAEAGLPTLRQILFEMRLPQLLKKAEADEAEAALAAQRVLETAFVRTSFYMPRDFRREGDLERARLSLEVASRIKPENVFVWYRLAQVFSAGGREQKAIEALERAVSLGFRQLDRVRDDPEFKNLHGDPRFRSLLPEKH